MFSKCIKGLSGWNRETKNGDITVDHETDSNHTVIPVRKSNLVFGQTDNVFTKYSISRENETHTKQIDVPSPFESKFRIDDELEPSRYIFMEFEGIHDSNYIGVNAIEFYDEFDEMISYTNIKVDGETVDHEYVQPAFPTDGWWAVEGGCHSLLFDFGIVTAVEKIYIRCINSAATPKYIRITDAKSSKLDAFEGKGFHADIFLQLAGDPGTDPKDISFRSLIGKEDEGVSCDLIINGLNSDPPQKGFESYISICGEYNFVFYRDGLRTRVCNYFFGADPSNAINLANNTTLRSGVTIDDVVNRAMTLEELRAIRAVIVSHCVRDKWKSSRDGRRICPDEVNLYDLNAILIKPLTKKRNCAFKELFGTGDSSPTYYVSHWWGEKVLDFILCCEYHAMLHELSPSEAKYWVCAHANRQHDLGADLGTDPADSSFNRAMQIAQGVLLVIDPAVVVTSRIWVDYELFRTITTKSAIDITTYNKGKVHLISHRDFPNEVPYEKNQRQRRFPFKEVCRKFLKIQLFKGEASQEIDKVRILNVMRNKGGNLDDYSVLKRIENSCPSDSDPLYLEDMVQFSKSDSSLRAEMASKAVAVALSTDGQTLDNFYGFNLVDIISRDENRTELIFNDLVALESVDNLMINNIFGLIRPNIEKFVLNVCGCVNLTEAFIYELHLPDGLKHLNLNIGSAKHITNEALLHLATVIPQELEVLALDVSGFKTSDGQYLPQRDNDHLKTFAINLPQTLQSYSLATTLDIEENGDGLLALAKALPRGLKEFSIKIYEWHGYKEDYYIDMVRHLPPSLESLSINHRGGEWFKDDEFKSLTKEVLKLASLKSFYMRSQIRGRAVFRLVENLSDLRLYL